jgi:TubC N-terminal docking domain
MNVIGIVQTLARRGIELTPDGDGIIVEPASRLTDDDRRVIRAHKPELLAYLRSREVARFCEADRIDAGVAGEIARIEDAALGLGWSYERLWNSHFWPHSTAHARGLAAVLQPGDTIVEVGHTFIVILAQRHHLQRFAKTDD